MFRSRYKILGSGIILLATAWLVGACGGGSTSQPAGPTATPTKAAAQAPAPAAKDLQDRISSSLNRTLSLDEKTLASYHIEVSGSEPVLNQDTKKVETETYSLKADVSGEDVHMTQTITTGSQAAKTTEGYIIGGGMAKSEAGGKEYETVAGKTQESFWVSLTWVTFPLRLIAPLTIAATGSSAQGEETIDGRAAEKYGVDSANAPAGVMGILSAMFTVTSSKGTVWVDKQTGALLKATLDFQQNEVDPPGSGTVVGTGSGHIEISVTKVGQVSVALPK